ncbi:MAG: thymidylate synthase, partial [Clostridia bacterium]|nr:thymidylate synthase [Clostridia bacterium]
MSLTVEIFFENVKDILENGVSDADMEVRPRWDDGTPAHTIKKFCIVNRYDLQKEFPITTLRYTNFRAAL